MDTSDQLVIDKSKESGGLNETSESASKTNLPTSDWKEANLSNKVNASSISEESRAEETIKTPNSNRGRGKATSPKNAGSSPTKKKEGTVGLVVSSNLRSSLDGHHAQTIKRPVPLSPTKPPSAAKPGGVKEKERSAQSEKSSPVGSLSPTEANAKPRRAGSLPSSGFSFRSDERAQKRKEFNSKIAEKNRAREVEKNVLEEKSKENADAEIKTFRKSLVFKATPLPSFYHEPPPKVELKKTPPTRARSPKFGHSNRSHCMAEAQNHVSGKGTSPQQRARRQSLPQLPSEDTTLAGATEGEENREWRETDQQGAQASRPRPNHTDSL